MSGRVLGEDAGRAPQMQKAKKKKPTVDIKLKLVVFNIQKGLKKKPVGRKNPNKLWGPRGLKKKSKQTLGPYTGLKV